MKLFWDDLDAADWDRHHVAASAALQQDWAYGRCMKSIGVPCVRTGRDGVAGVVLARASLDRVAHSR
jgi:hypothetical protein